MLHPRAHLQSRIISSSQGGSRCKVCTTGCRWTVRATLTAFPDASHIRVIGLQPLFSTPNSVALVAVRKGLDAVWLDPTPGRWG